MTAVFSAEEILEFTGARLATGMMPDYPASICIDTRLLVEGQWFLALPGQTFDGHDFIGDAFSRGAIGCIVEERANYPIASTSFPLLAVADTEEALCVLAGAWRKRNQARLCLLLKAGDQSEKLVKELESAEGAFDTSFLLKSDVDWQEISLALLDLAPESQALVLEYQPRNLDKIDAVARATAPDVVIILSEAFSHLRLQMSAEKILEGEQLLADCLTESMGVLLVSEDAAFTQIFQFEQYFQSEQKASDFAPEDSELSFAPEADFAPPKNFLPQENTALQRSVIIVNGKTDLANVLMDIMRVRRN
jgi:UDP-N-acetylmuramoyl-tripeptide--D-alanyl-D-alanine ligase